MASGTIVTVTGLDAALRDVRATRAELLPALGRALRDEAGPVMAASQALVPVDTSALKQTGTVHEPEIRGAAVSVELTYGGGGVDYAAKVHEDLGMRHPRGGQAKFLEQPFLEAANGLGERVGARVVRAIGRD